MKDYSKAQSNGEVFFVPQDGSGKTIETITASATLTADQSGRKLHVGTDALTLTLPSTVSGLRYEIVNTGSAGAVGITVSPAAADKIVGSYDDNGRKVVMTGTDNKDLVNTKATAKTGDRLVLVGDGSVGWYIEEAQGTWTEEDQSTDDVLEKAVIIETVTDDKTLDANDSGKTFVIATDAKTFTLPATVEGMEITIVNTGADGAVGITVSPNASDKIIGGFVNDGQSIIMSGTDDKDLVNTKATANNGDYIKLLGDGSVGWIIQGGHGIWTEESQSHSYASPYEVITGAETLVAADSGKTLFLDAAAGAEIALPAVSAGLKFKFVIASTFATTPWTIVTNGGDNVIQGGAIVNSTFVAASDEDQIEFDEGSEAVGDYVELVCDATNWFVSGVGAGAGSIVFTAT